MVPPAMLRQHRFATGNVVLLVAFVSLTGMFFFVTLFFQNVEGWSALEDRRLVDRPRCAVLVRRPVERAADETVLAGRGHRRRLRGGGGRHRRPLVRHRGTPIAEVEWWYVGIAVGFGLLSPAASTVVMSSVEGGASGIASGILNTSRQVGTSVGLAVLGSIGVTVAARQWRADVVDAPTAALRQAGDGLVGPVTSGQIGTVRHEVGATWRPGRRPRSSPACRSRCSSGPGCCW